MTRNIPTELLRTFLELVDTKSFSQTASRIGRTQSTVSLQMKRLQEIAGAPLTTSSGKDLALTQTGALVESYAKRILDLNDECVRFLEGKVLGGTIRIGIPSDFAIALLPTALGRFSIDFPDVSLEVTCRVSSELIQMLDAGDLDIVVALDEIRNSRHLQSIWNDPVVWIGRASQQLHKLRPLPVVMFPDRCLYRARIFQTLTRHSIPYRIAFSSESMAANQSAIEAGLGVTALSRHSIPPNMTILPPTPDLPDLPDVHVGLYWNSRGAAEATSKLAEFLGKILIAKLGTSKAN